jgi:hypothetical protein
VVQAMREAGLPVTRNSRAQWCVRTTDGPVRLWVWEAAAQLTGEPLPEPPPVPPRPVPAPGPVARRTGRHVFPGEAAS